MVAILPPCPKAKSSWIWNSLKAERKQGGPAVSSEGNTCRPGNSSSLFSGHHGRSTDLESEHPRFKSWLFCWLAVDFSGGDSRSFPEWREHWAPLFAIVLSVSRSMTSSRNGSSPHSEPRPRESALDPPPTGLWWSAWMTHGVAFRMLMVPVTRTHTYSLSKPMFTITTCFL